MNELQILELISRDEFEDSHTTYYDLMRANVKQLARIADRLHADDLSALLAISALLYKKSRRTFAVEMEGNALPDSARQPRCNKCGM